MVSDLASPVTVSDTPEALLAAFCEREWCDGLPIVPPTEERVRAMLGKAPPERSLGAMPPLWRQATLEKLAVNAVMAGCRPEYFPVIVAACSGPRTIRSWLCEKYQPTFEPSDTAVSATVARIPAAPVDTWSFTLCGASPPNTVTALSPPRSGPQGEASSRSAMQYVNFAGLPWVAMS